MATPERKRNILEIIFCARREVFLMGKFLLLGEGEIYPTISFYQKFKFHSTTTKRFCRMKNQKMRRWDK